MKKFLLWTVLVLLMLPCGSSCSRNRNQEPVNMDELLKISTWLLDDELEGMGRWGYIDPSTRTFPRKEDGNGYWIPDDGVSQVDNEDVFEYEALKTGEVRTMAPMGMHMSRSDGNHIGYQNLVLDIEFDGIVKIRKLEPNDTSIRLRYGPPLKPDESLTFTGPCSINVCPVGKVLATEGMNYLMTTDTLADREYTIEIQGCTLGGDPVITAVVKLTAIPDPEYPWQTISGDRYSELYQANEERTRFCTIELVSYTYSEMYILGGAAGNID